jgi:hypothetical protein
MNAFSFKYQARRHFNICRDQIACEFVSRGDQQGDSTARAPARFLYQFKKNTALYKIATRG